MAETLLSPTTIHLYGRQLEDLKVALGELPDTGPPPDNSDGGPPPRLGGNNFLLNQLKAHVADGLPDQYPRFARIYCFGYEGAIYDLARPQIFLVHGLGTLAEGPVPGPPGIATNERRYSRAPGELDRTAV